MHCKTVPLWFLSGHQLNQTLSHSVHTGVLLYWLESGLYMFRLLLPPTMPHLLCLRSFGTGNGVHVQHSL